MALPNDHDFMEIQDALWTHLNNQDSYVALRADSLGEEALKEYRFSDGIMLAANVDEGIIAASALPCLSAIWTGWWMENMRGDARSGNRMLRRRCVKLEMSFITRASDGDGTLSAQWANDRMVQLESFLDVQEKHQALAALLGGGDFDWTPIKAPLAGKNGEMAGAPVLWVAKWEITLMGRFRHR